MKETSPSVLLKHLQLKESCLNIASLAHADQVDKAKEPYLLHPLWVSATLSETPYRSVLKRHMSALSEEEKEYAQCVALLHDMIEDSPITSSDLLTLYHLPKDIVEAVIILTKTKGEDYSLYLKRVKENKLARVVKLSDLLHNSDLRRLSRIKEEDIQRRLKYLKSILYLWDDLVS
jgi:(p)ppGpp synthase/HD superfamily hydrolase